MIDKLRLLNPLRPLASLEEAGIAARAGAVGAFVSVASSVRGLVEFYLSRDKMLAAMGAASGLHDGQMSKSAVGAIQTGMLGFATGMIVLTGLIYLIFGLIQWRRRTKLIPLVMLLFSAYGVLMILLGLLAPRTLMQAELEGPWWSTALSVALEILILAMFWAGYRGGRYLQRAG